MPILLERIEVPGDRRVLVPDSIETDGDRTHLIVSAQTSGRTRFRWEDQERLEIEHLHPVLRDSRVEDLVFAARSLPDGRLFDEDGVELPRTFFDPISPSLRTLSIFTCFGEEVLNRYSLRKVLDSGVSYHSERELRVSDAFCGDEDPEEPVLPSPSRFRSFLKKVEEGIRILRNREWWQDEPLRVDPGRAYCSLLLRFEGKDPVRFGFFLNERFIATKVGEPEVLQHISYPCSFLVPGRNLIRVQEFRKSGIYPHSPADFQFEPLIPGRAARGVRGGDGFEFYLESGGPLFPFIEF